MVKQIYDHLIIGAGIIGLTLAKAISERYPRRSILVLEKEPVEAAHASGRNSGVLHAGFYYTANSLKARLTVAGSRAMKAFCREHDLPINECGKVVVAQNAEECAMLLELERRGQRNGSRIHIISEEEAREIDLNVKTFQKALHSPDTASIDPVAVCRKLKDLLEHKGVEFRFNTAYLKRKRDRVHSSSGDFRHKHLINCAGLYADKIAREFGFSRHTTIIPFKGIYLKYTKNKTDILTNIYPVPNLKNPFLGVHFTKTVDGSIKIGPTAMPAFWRENYQGWDNFDLGEMCDIGWQELRLLLSNRFGFRDLALEEMRKYQKSYLIALASRMVRHIDPEGFTESTAPGIRAQLFDRRSQTLVQDFCVEGDAKSLHVLNAVSPAFTCAIPIAEYLLRQYVPADL